MSNKTNRLAVLVHQFADTEGVPVKDALKQIQVITGWSDRKLTRVMNNKSEIGSASMKGIADYLGLASIAELLPLEHITHAKNVNV